MLISTVALSRSFWVSFRVVFLGFGLYTGVSWPVRAAFIVWKAAFVSVNYVLLPSSCGDQVVLSILSSSSSGPAIASSSGQGRSVLSSCSIETGEISALGRACLVGEERFLSCRLLSLQANAWSLCTMSS